MPGNDSNTLLLIHSNNSDGYIVFTDSALGGNVPHSITTVGNTHHEVNYAKFGGSSIQFDDSGDALTLTANSDWNFSTGNFTIDFWVYRTSDPDNDYLFDIGSNQNFFRLYSGYRWDFYAAGVYIFQYTYSITKNSWHHVAIVKSATNNTQLYIDGISKTMSSTVYSFGSAALVFTIGNYGGGGAYSATCYIDEFRVSNVARCIFNFIPPVRIYSSSNYYIEGTTSQSGIEVSRQVYLYRQDTGVFLDSFTSLSGIYYGYDIKGYFICETTYSGNCFVVCMDDAVGEDYEHLITGNITPILA